MARVMVFNNISLDGYFTDAHGDMGFGQNTRPDPEWDEYVRGNASGGGEGLFLFGRITYDMMASYWPTPIAQSSMPQVAASMNNTPKVVFSRTLEQAGWQNSRLVKEDLAGEVRRLKAGDRDMVIFGSGTIVSQLTRQHLVDEYQFIVVPVILGGGRTLFDGLKEKVPLQLVRSRSFANGNVLLVYTLEE